MACRRSIKIVLVFSLLGAVVNLVVAWVMVYTTQVPYSSSVGIAQSGSRIEGWPVPAPQGWPGNAAVVDRWVAPGLERRELTTSIRTIETSTTAAKVTNYSMSATLAGPATAATSTGCCRCTRHCQDSSSTLFCMH